MQTAYNLLFSVLQYNGCMLLHTFINPGFINYLSAVLERYFIRPVH